MGCDIHLYVEIYHDATERWRLVPPPPPNQDVHPAERHDVYDGWYHNRNYDVFAMLTSTVRNNGNIIGIVPEPRGVPEDISIELAAVKSPWDHSPGWLRLDELLAYFERAKSMTAMHRGVIPLREADDTLRLGPCDPFETWSREPPRAPRSYSGDVMGRDIVIVDVATAHRILAAPDRPHAFEVRREDVDLARFATGQGFGYVTNLTEHTYVPGGPLKIFVRVEWPEAQSDSADDFVKFMTKHLVPLGAPDKVRIVFGFDS